MNKLELLAPAGNIESFYAAINAGADAIYLGLDDFNARIKAENFSVDNIKEVVDYAHLRDVKVYVTVNIIIKDSEYDKLFNMIQKTMEAHVDAYLIQDLGVAEFLKKHFPLLVLHASTQMGIHNLYGAQVAEKLGFSRIVLSRETKLEDIKLIKENTSLEIEYFIQGALCVSFSGNCYLSSFSSLNSGNRGRCQQLCRLKYQSFGNDKFLKSGYLLSARDLSLIKNIKLLKDVGVDSFKIEGRLRRKGYVSVVTSTYRKLIDLIENDKYISNELIIDSIIDLKKEFSRGDFLYDAYLKNGNISNVINENVQNHMGVKIGKSISCKAFKDIYEIEVYSTHNIKKGDGLKFVKDNKEIVSLGVGNVNVLKDNKYRIFSKNKVLNGLDMYLTLDEKLESSSLSNIIKKPIDIYVYAYPSSPLVITINYNKLSVTESSDFIIEEAKNVSTTKEEIITQISKLNDTPFYINNINVEIENCFIPKSVVNQARRNALKLLEEEILKNHKKDILINENIEEKDYIPSYTKNIFIINEKIKLSSLANFDLTDKLITFVFSDYSQADAYIKYIKDAYPNNDYAINLPIISNNKDIAIIDKIIKTYDFILIANNISHIKYIKENKVIAGLGLNICSKQSFNTYMKLGCINAILSLETEKKILDELHHCYYYSIGYNTLMNFSHCPYQVNYNTTCGKCSFNDSLLYQDDSHKKMKIRRTRICNCYFELLNSHLLNTYKDTNNVKVIDLRNLDETNIQNVSLLINGEIENITGIDSKGLLFKKVK
ncbi:MAG: U32 family peptidase [Bacilli bacterium]